ncbi:transposase family protein [Streptomyces sp. DT2A-34]|uniref:helix-turn-helix domain-containing protein n=1 Tax=Streptomyces sp. DT2A-34 TaxID=3051182 RepID=UPI00265C73D0|nr:transposase family protein [Streptomyces sp. DT2A-34]MDO0916220.1 transposase family protein [Streptomyces sp. DT2A-34]
MSRINVTSLRPRSPLHWTGLPIKAFLVLVARVAALLPSETRRWRPWTLLLDNRVLAAAMAWRTNLTHRQLADFFGVGVATVHRILDRLTPLVAGLLEPPAAPARTCGSWIARSSPSRTRSRSAPRTTGDR